MMKNILIILAIVLIASPLWAAANKVEVAKVGNVGGSFDLRINNDQPLGGLALALKFADEGSDVVITSFDFKDTRVENVELKDVIIDNEKKTVLVYAIPLQNTILPGEGPIVKLTFSGKGNIKFEPTTVAKQEGISLVSTDAKELSFDTDFTVPGISGMPTSFSVSQNYPNPFNASTVIRYSLPENARVKIEIFNILGQRVKTLLDEVQTAGYKSIEWNGTDAGAQTVASGVYFYKIDVAGQRSEVKQMTMLK